MTEDIGPEIADVIYKCYGSDLRRYERAVEQVRRTGVLADPPRVHPARLQRSSNGLVTYDA